MTSYEVTIKNVFVYPELNGYKNVVRKIDWEIKFSRGGAESFGGGESVVDVSNLENFTPVEQLTQDQLCEWAMVAHGGRAYLEELCKHHDEMLDYKLLFKGTVKLELKAK